MRFGVQIPQEGVDFAAVLAHARAAEKLGCDSVWIPDHLRVVAVAPGSTTVPFMIVGATDARLFRKIGATCYGYGLFSERIPFTEFATRSTGTTSASTWDRSNSRRNSGKS